MHSFYRDDPTPRTSWRQAILMGANTRTYKFSLGAALLEVADSGRDAVSLVELAGAYATHMLNRTGNYPQASSALELSDTDFLSILAREREASLASGAPTEQLVDAAVRSIPGMVMQKFHNLPGQGEVAHRFYEIEGRGSSRLVRLTPEMMAVVAEDSGVLSEEIDARWRIVEASFDAEIGRALIGRGAELDLESGQLIAPVRRVPLTSIRGSIVGFQKNRCFYCHQQLGDLFGADVHVDHVFPWHWMNTGSWHGPHLDRVWNLVLACAPCNLGKSGRNPTNDEVRRLLERNDAIAQSLYPLRTTLSLSMGGAKTGEQRTAFISAVYNLVTEGRGRY
jgi:hypothetical protein